MRTMLLAALIAAAPIAIASTARAQAAALAAPEATTIADDPPEPAAADAEVRDALELVLRDDAERARSERELSGWMGLVLSVGASGGGAALMGLGADAHDDLLFTLGGVSAAVGLGAMVTSILQLATTSAPERRYARFLSLRDRATARDLGRFEGELLATSESALDLRVLSIGSAVALLASGAALLGYAAAFASTDDLQIYGYSIGATYALLGTLELVSALLPSDAEESWRRYLQSIAVVPVITPTGGGASVVGRF